MSSGSIILKKSLLCSAELNSQVGHSDVMRGIHKITSFGSTKMFFNAYEWLGEHCEYYWLKGKVKMKGN